MIFYFKNQNIANFLSSVAEPNRGIGLAVTEQTRARIYREE